jgi:hypothetical protein
MSKKRAIIFIIVAFIIGAIVTGGSVGCFFIRRLAIQNKFLDYQFQCQPEITTALVSMHVLKQFHSDQTSNSNAVEYLESQLDYSVAGIGQYIRHNPMAFHDPNFPVIERVISSAKRYREQFPRTNQDVLLQSNIEYTFSFAEVKTNK